MPLCTYAAMPAVSSMPEGDTLHRIARTLQSALAGKRVTRFETVLPKLARVDDETPIRGRTIERVRAVGKHLLIELSGGLELRTHLRMNGSWHIYRTGERWQRPRIDMRVVLGTEEWEAVGFNLPVAEFCSVDTPVPVGPDLLADEIDVDDAIARLRLLAGEEIAEALLNQRAVSGIGNIWKSETLWTCRVSPFVKVETIDDVKLREIVLTARKLLRHSFAGSSRSRFSVYGRRGEPCRRCGTPIEMRKQGRDARVTYWCARCQLQ
jgi:endonuclease-8